MPTLTMTNFRGAETVSRLKTKTKRIESIDLLRGVVMIIMALDHVRDYFHRDAFYYSPTDLTQTSVVLFFTRFITHYCAPVFVFLAGVSAYLYGMKRTRKELSFYLFTRGLWLVFTELIILQFARTFNPSFPFFNLQVIWAIGISMIILSAMVYMNRSLILLVSFLLIFGHNLFDSVHAPQSFLWSALHEPNNFYVGRFLIMIHYPLLPWIGLIGAGYCVGRIYAPDYDADARKKTLLMAGIGAIILFVILRSGNFYGDAAVWSTQKNGIFSALSFINVTKYPPSLLYVLVTLGPAFIFLSLAERPLNAITSKIAVFGRVPFFYYVAHIFLIHTLAMIGAMLTGYNWSDMVLSQRVNSQPELKGYGFGLGTVYLVWIGLVLFLYPFCRWFDKYKRANQSKKPWLSYC